MDEDLAANIFAWIVTLAILALIVFVAIKFVVLPFVDLRKRQMQYMQESAKVEKICLDNGYPELIGVSQGIVAFDFENMVWYCSKRSDNQDIVVSVDSLN